MTAPTFVTSYSPASDWSSTTTPKTQSVTVAAGDILAVLGGTEGHAYTLATPTGGSLTYTLQQSSVVTGNCSAYAWTATPGSGQTFTLSDSESGGTAEWGDIALRFSGSAGVGTSVTDTGSGAPSYSITTTAANSAIAVIVLDFAGVSGSSRTWLTVNGYTPSSGNGYELEYTNNGGNYGVYVAYYPDAGAAGAKTVGLSAPTGMTWALIAVEIKGSSSVSVSLPVAQVNVQAYPPGTGGTGAPTAPAFQGAYSPASGDWVTATSPKTLALTANAGDIVLLFGGTETSSTTLGTPSDGTNGYTLKQSQDILNTCAGYLWVATIGAAAALSVVTTSLPGASDNVAYSQSLAASGGSGVGYTWTVLSGSLPAWASLSASTGVISGTPTGTGTASFTVKVTDSLGATATQALSITTSSAILPVGPGGAWTLVFEDDFSGTALNTNNWTAVNGANNSGVTTTSSAVSVSGGYCRLLVGGMINSNPVNGFPGPSTGPVMAVGNCVEAYVNFPGPTGDSAYNWPAFWTSGANWPSNGEIDIFESYNGTPSALNYHSPSGANNGPFPPGNWCNSLHTYTFVRGKTSLQVWWDGVLMRTVTPNDAGGGQSILFLIGSANTPSSTAETLVKYVRMWTPG